MRQGCPLTEASMHINRRTCITWPVALPLSGLARSLSAQTPAPLSLYTSMPGDDMKVITDAFTQQSGIAVNTWRSGSDQIAQRAIAEFRAGRPGFDLLETQSPSLQPVREAGALMALDQLGDFKPIAAVTPAHATWSGTRHSVMCCAWNTRLVKADEVPQSYQDLLHPRWRQCIALEADNHAWYAAMHQSMGVATARRWFEGLAAQGVLVRKGHSLIANLLATGELPLTLHVYSYKAGQLEQDGSPIRHRFFSPMLGNTAAIAMARNSPRAASAARFIRFIQDSGQTLMAARHHIPVLGPKRPGTPDPAAMVSIDADFNSGESARRWRREYQDFLRRGSAAM